VHPATGFEKATPGFSSKNTKSDSPPKSGKWHLPISKQWVYGMKTCFFKKHNHVGFSTRKFEFFALDRMGAKLCHKKIELKNPQKYITQSISPAEVGNLFLFGKICQATGFIFPSLKRFFL